MDIPHIVALFRRLSLFHKFNTTYLLFPLPLLRLSKGSNLRRRTLYRLDRNRLHLGVRLFHLLIQLGQLS